MDFSAELVGRNVTWMILQIRRKHVTRFNKRTLLAEFNDGRKIGSAGLHWISLGKRKAIAFRTSDDVLHLRELLFKRANE